MDFKKIGIDILNATKEHSPELMVGLGVCGFVATVIMAVKVTPKAVRIVEKEEKKLNRDLTKKEIVRETYKCYIPTVVMGTAALACIIFGTTTNCKRNAALAAAYTASQESMKIYKEKVVEAIGEKKEKLVQDEVDKEKIKRNPVKNNEVIITAKGKTLCYEPISGRYFESDIEQVRRAIEELNKRIRDEYYVDLNDYYDLIGLPNIVAGDVLGWNSDDYPIDPRYSSQLAEDDRPCLVIDVGTASPRYDFRRQY